MNRHPFNYENKYLIDLIEFLYNQRLIIFKITFLLTFLSIVFSFTLEKSYTSYSTFYPHYQTVDKNSGIKNLAGIAGIDLGNNESNIIPTSLYPQLILSRSFKYEILNKKITNINEELSYREYLNKNYNQKTLFSLVFNKINLLKEIFIKPKDKPFNKSLNYITKNDNELFSILENKIILNINEDDGFIKLSVFDKNPEVSAQVALLANEILQKKIIEFKLKNINDVYLFTISQLKEAKEKLFNIQDSLANFKDSNKSIKSDIFLNQLERLETEFNIRKNIYNELAITKEKTAIDVRKNTPIFTIIDPVIVPYSNSRPNKILIIFIGFFLGIIVSLSWILSKSFIQNLIKRL